MRRRTPLFQAVEDALVSSGLQNDRHSLKKLLWESASQVIFARGKIRRKKDAEGVFGGAEAGDPNAVRGLSQQQYSDGTRMIWAATGADITRWAFSGVELVDSNFGTYHADGSSIYPATMYDFTHFGDWTIVNSGIGAAKIHQPGIGYGTYAAGEAPTDVVQFMKKMNQVIAIGYGARGTRVGWSDADDIMTWTAAADNLAGSISVDEFDTPIRAGSRLGDAISVFAEDQMGLIRYVGQPYIYGQKAVLDGIGAIGKAAVATDTRVNVGVGRAGVWWTDGNSSRYIDEGFLSDYLQDNVNWAQGSKIVAARNDYTGCFEFYFPMLGSNLINEGWAWDPSSGGWSPIPANSYATERRLFGYPIVGNNVGTISFGDYDTGTVPAMYLETKPLVMQTEESSHVSVHIDELDLLLHKASHIEFQIGCSEEPNRPHDEWEWTDWEPAEIGAKLNELQRLPEAPFWKLALRSTPGAANWDIDLQGFLLYGIAVGTKN